MPKSIKNFQETMTLPKEQNKQPKINYIATDTCKLLNRESKIPILRRLSEIKH